MEELSDQERDFSASASDSGPVEEEPSLPTADELEDPARAKCLQRHPKLSSGREGVRLSAAQQALDR